LKAIPPAPEGGAGKKGKAKGSGAVEARGLSEARGLVDKIEKGTWTPEVKTSRGYDYRVDCARCGTKTSQYHYIDGHAYCTTCQPIIKAEHEQLKAKLAAAVDKHLGAWLDSLPELAESLLLLQHRSDGTNPRGAELRGIFADWLWRYRSNFKLVEQPAEAAAPTAPDVGAQACTDGPTALTDLRGIIEKLEELEERWAAGQVDTGDAELLDGLADRLDELDLDEDTRARLIARIGQLQAHLDEEGVPQ
jgi:hypothetical protein